MHTVRTRLFVACCMVATLCPPAAAEPAPSAGEVARARATVKQRAKALGVASVRLAAANTRLDELAVNAGRMVEAYNGQIVQLDGARERHSMAMERLKAAEDRVAATKAAVSMLATQSYAGMDLSNPMVSLFSDGGGLEGYLHRTSTLESIGQEQTEKLKQVRDTQQVATVLRAQAEDAYTEQQRAAAQAEEAKAAAEAAVDTQQRETEAIEAEKVTLEKRVDAARTEAEQLARQRATAMEQARLERQQRLAKASGAGSAARWMTPGQTTGDVVANWALTQLGKPYVWAAAGPSGFDCSGLSMRAWEKVGVRLDHWTGTQWNAGPHVPLNQLQRGDLLFFGKVTNNPGDIHHVGIFVGRGMMVHAPQTGDVVRIASMWRRDLVGATRPR
ncbi:C40 family peptidase [Nonomuraea sp. NPDC003804]|uniref:C40 family peptidase n=1 Tax=Nonomuraea sp. NPDC003804 TaxID=3154547 RepID=UPI0033B5EFE3